MSNYGIRRGMNLGGKRKEKRMMRRHEQRLNYAKNHPDSDLAKLLRGEYEPS